MAGSAAGIHGSGDGSYVFEPGKEKGLDDYRCTRTAAECDKALGLSHAGIM